MISVINVSLRFADKKLFENVNLKFTEGNCYGIIGANGAGKSTFLQLLTGDMPLQSGEINIPKNIRMSVLKQDHFLFDDYTVLDTVLMGNKRLYEIMKEKDALYAKEDFTEADGERAGKLEEEFAEMDGWSAEANASMILQGLGIDDSKELKFMKELTGADKVKVILANALFGDPDVLILDEPTNHLDAIAIAWLEEFLINFLGTVVIVSHDRHFLNKVCTHTCDIDYHKIKMYSGNYDFWQQSSELALQMTKDSNKKKEEKIKQLESFIARFSANASKSKQATSRKKTLEKITLDDIQPSSRRYPFVDFKMNREPGKDLLELDKISYEDEYIPVLKDVSFTVRKDDKIALIGDNEIAVTALYKILNGEVEPTSGTFKFGVTITTSYFPKDNTEFFEGVDLSLVDWLRQFSKEQDQSYIRGFLGRMLFSGDNALKKARVLSGGEKVRCMLSRMMLKEANFIMLDQPTNHLDLESITSVNKALQNFKSNVIFSSHDHELLQTVANRVIEIQNDGTIIDYDMTYDEYLDLKKKNNKK